MLYKFKPLDRNRFTSDKMQLFIDELNEVITDRFFTRDELLGLEIDLYPLEFGSDKVGDETIDNFLKRVDELGFAVDFSVSTETVWVTKQDGTPLVEIAYEQDLENRSIIEKGFYDIGEYYQIQLDKLIGETNFASLWEE